MMTGKQIYKLAIDLGIKNDLRGSKLVKDRLKRTNDKYNKLGDDEKNEFDNELLNNPYSDTRYFGDLDKKVKRRMQSTPE